MEKRPESKCSTIPKSFFMRLLVFFQQLHWPQLSCLENTSHYTWGKPLTRMFLEVQCVSVATIVMSQVWILSDHGITVVEIVSGYDMAVIFVYLLGILIGTLGYMKPSYWRISAALLAYMLCLYFSLVETHVQTDVMMTPAFLDFLKANPEHTKIWIPWVIGFAFHVNMSVTSLVLTVISLRDMYHFDPINVSQVNNNCNVKKETIRHTRGERFQVVPYYAIAGITPLCNVNGGYVMSSSEV
ncbi:unnamed protein product [Orchesella dallaii]|uniref:Uncharacterized protein n=1 Tax=Orchesella dallaii TaxID=48710 RepID=A0ABP1PVY6_9HEXA